MFSSTTLFSNRRSVHFAWPSGGFEQAKAMSLASFSPSKMRGTGGVARRLRLNTAVTPPSTHCLRTRAHMTGYVPKASEICVSLHFTPAGLSSARKSILALSCCFAELFPLADQFLEVLPFGRSQFDDIASLAHLRLRRSGRDKSESFIPYDLVDAA